MCIHSKIVADEDLSFFMRLFIVFCKVCLFLSKSNGRLWGNINNWFAVLEVYHAAAVVSAKSFISVVFLRLLINAAEKIQLTTVIYLVLLGLKPRLSNEMFWENSGFQVKGWKSLIQVDKQLKRLPKLTKGEK